MLSFLVFSDKLNTQTFNKIAFQLAERIKPDSQIAGTILDNYYINIWHEGSREAVQVGVLEPLLEFVEERFEVKAFNIIFRDTFPLYLDKREVIETIFENIQKILPEPDLKIFDLHTNQLHLLSEQNFREVCNYARDSLEQGLLVSSDFRQLVKTDPDNSELLSEHLSKYQAPSILNFIDSYFAELETRHDMTGQKVETHIRLLLEAWDRVEDTEAAKFLLGKFFHFLTIFNYYLSPTFHLDETIPRIFRNPEFQTTLYGQLGAAYVLLSLCNQEEFNKHHELIGKYVEKIQRLESFAFKAEIVSRFELEVSGNARTTLEKYFELADQERPLRRDYLRHYGQKPDSLIHLYYKNFIEGALSKKAPLSVKWKIYQYGWNQGLTALPTKLLTKLAIGLVFLLSPLGFLFYDYYNSTLGNSTLEVVNANPFNADSVIGLIFINALVTALIFLPLWLLGEFLWKRFQRLQSIMWRVLIALIATAIVGPIVFFGYVILVLVNFDFAWYQSSVKALGDESIHYASRSLDYDEVESARFDAGNCDGNCEAVLEFSIKPDSEEEIYTQEWFSNNSETDSKICEIYQRLETELNKRQVPVEKTPEYIKTMSQWCS